MKIKKNINLGIWVLILSFLSLGYSALWAAQMPVPEIVRAARIKKISISGAFPVYKKDIQNIMTVSVGDMFQKDKVDNQAVRISALLKKEGYINPEINIFIQQDKTDGHYILNVQIKKGQFLKIAAVQIDGNRNISSAKLKLKLKSYSVLPGRERFVKAQVDSDTKKLIQIYREKGFADVQVVSQTNETTDKQGVVVRFSITEGPVYRFLFKGNSALAASLLKKENVLFKEGNKNGFGIKKTIRNIKTLYMSHGYADVSVTSQIVETTQNNLLVKQVSFSIDEGSLYLVSSLTIKGNESIDQTAISRQILTGTPRIFNGRIYDKKILAEDLNAVRILYLNNGYSRTRVDKSVEFSDAVNESAKNIKNVVIEIRIAEGPQTRVGKIQFPGLVYLTQDQAMEMISLKPGTLYREFMIASDENVLKAAVSEQGYPHIRIETQENISQDETVADLVFKIDPGPGVTVRNVFYAGNFRTSSSVLEKEMRLKPGDTFSLTRLLESRRNILNMTALDSARITVTGLKEKSSQVDLIVEVQEKTPYYLEFGSGYDTRRHLYAQAVVGDRNFLGRNLNLENTLEISQIGYQSTVSLYEPKFMRFGISSSTRMFAEKKEEFNKDFGTRVYGFSQEFFRPFLSDRLTVGFGGEYRSREQYKTETGAADDQGIETFERRDIVVFSSSTVIRTTDSFVQPKKGVLSFIDIEISNGLDNDLDDFVKYQLDTRFYFTPYKNLTLAWRGRYGLVQPYGENSAVTEDQLFFLGGTSTVRGFDENLLRYDADHHAVGGKQILLGNLEARIDIWSNLEFAVFYDIGSVSGVVESFGSDDFRSSVGCGIRYLTPIGPIGLLYGHKLDTKPGESSGSFHFSMGYTF